MSEHESQSLKLTAVQRRILGVLIEKAFTTPDQYPLTLNALVTGCNQKSNRNPVSATTENEIAIVLQELLHMGLVRHADVQRTSRANRFEHDVARRCGWSPREQAVLAELFLRGPQTVGELRTRADRMVKMPDLQYVQGILDELAANDPPTVEVMPRVPGQSAVRLKHTLSQEQEESPRETVMPIPAETEEKPDISILIRLDELERRVAALESRLANDRL